MRVNVRSKSGLRLMLGAVLFFLTACVSHQSAREVGDGSIDLFLLIGQSNMAGRGVLPEVARTSDERVLMLTEGGEWTMAIDPLHFDKPAVVGVGPGLSFGETLAASDETLVIGLIPSAVGGSSIAVWSPGGFHEQTATHPYDDAIERTKKAMENGTLKGILWHQGESDAKPGKVDLYRAALTDLAVNLRRDLNAPDVPFIIGGLGEYLAERSPETVTLTAILEETALTIPNAGFVSAAGLSHNGDGVHFSTESARDLGHRYARKYIELRER